MSKLYLIPTPIGNLEDITLRSLRILRECDFLLAEDTRKTKKLLNHYDIKKKLNSYHAHNEHKVCLDWVEKIKKGKIIALVSDAGTPAISDPGFLIVRECINQGINVDCLPGATALIPALVNSGIPCNTFIFEGFLPVKKGRKKRLEALVGEKRTMVFYESPHRIEKTLNYFAQYFGMDRKIVVCRELTKLYGENIRGTIKKILELLKNKKLKGEFVIVVSGTMNNYE